MPNTTPAESILGPITPIRCTEPGCHWACHGVPDKYADSRARIVREHVAAEHAPTPEPADRPADQLRAALVGVAALHERFEGSTCGTCADADGQAAAWPCETASALAVARQLLGTTSCGCPHPVDEHSVYGCAEDCACEWMPPKDVEEDREQAADLATQLYRAQDALAFVGECCDIADRNQRTVTTGDVREWLKGARCGRQLLAASECGPVPDSCGDEPCANHEREQAHAEGEHAFCGPECAAALAADYASCPGYETSPNPCRCPCYGCKHHCSAHQPPAAPPAPADRAATGMRGLLEHVGINLTGRDITVAGEVVDRAPLRDRIRRAVCEAEGFAWDTDMLEPDEYGEVADAVLAVLAADAAAGVQPPTTEAELTATLVINRTDSYCDGCRKPTLPRNTHHTDISGWTPVPGGGCGARFTATRSDYRGITADDLKDVRPDLPVAAPPAAPAAPEEQR